MVVSASIQALIAGEQVAGSKLNSKLRDELLAEGMLLVTSRGSRKSYRARDTEALKRFLIDWDESYRILEVNASDSRASMAAETGNSKLVMVRSWEYLQAHKLSDRVLFVSRYPQSTDLRRWLCTISNHYLHFGDFDLAGIHIFLFDFQQYLGKERSSFLIPCDIESRLKFRAILNLA